MSEPISGVYVVHQDADLSSEPVLACFANEVEADELVRRLSDERRWVTYEPIYATAQDCIDDLGLEDENE